LVFRAETPEGEPAWNLMKKDMIVKENDDTCEVISIEPISTNRPIYIGLTMDHSYSMSFSLSFSNIIKWIRGRKDSIISPLDYSKTSAKLFISTFNIKKDYISIVAFGSSVDVELPLTQDTALLTKTINNIKLNGSTALYDAMLAGMKQINNRKGVNILVALTDGMENASSTTWQNVVDFSKLNNIPIYIIGLGSVDVDTLQIMAKETTGQFYHTNSSSSLVDIYKKISKQIQSFYALEYKSQNAALVNDKHNVKISFDINSIYLANDPLDPDVVTYLKEKNFNKRLRYFGIVSVFVLTGFGTISLIYIRRKRRKK
jgi:Ca-activated chloride channel family protein